VRAAVAAAAPEAVVDQLTSLPHDYNIRDPTFYAANDRVRREGTANVMAAARAAGVKRYIVQSVSFLTRPGGPPVLDEDAPP
jgi:nucleoside-diphosphate-sugar epimerase